MHDCTSPRSAALEWRTSWAIEVSRTVCRARKRLASSSDRASTLYDGFGGGTRTSVTSRPGGAKWARAGQLNTAQCLNNLMVTGLLLCLLSAFGSSAITHFSASPRLHLADPPAVLLRLDGCGAVRRPGGGRRAAGHLVAGRLGPARKWVAIGVRLLVLLLLILILGGVRWQPHAPRPRSDGPAGQSDSVDRTADWPGKFETDHSRYRDLDGGGRATTSGSSPNDPTKQPDDRIGVIGFKDYVQVDGDAEQGPAPGQPRRPRPPSGRGPTSPPPSSWRWRRCRPDAMHRLVLISDGNANLGDIEAAVNAAVAAARADRRRCRCSYDVQNDVSVERFVAPPWKRRGRGVQPRPSSSATPTRSPVTGKLRVIRAVPRPRRATWSWSLATRSRPSGRSRSSRG